MSRGDRREDIFLDDVDRQDFLKTLAEACQKADWQVHAYYLNDEIHFVPPLLVPEGKLGIRQMRLQQGGEILPLQSNLLDVIV